MKIVKSLFLLAAFTMSSFLATAQTDSTVLANQELWELLDYIR